MQRLAAGGHMELPDFDTLKELAASEPSRLDAILEGNPPEKLRCS